MIYPARTQPRSLLDRLLPLRTQTSSRFESTTDLRSADDPLQYDQQLAASIVTRIEERLPGRVRDLHVSATENAVILSGECSTFYTKQLAQHAAMGVLEYEQLINNIAVRVTK